MAQPQSGFAHPYFPTRDPERRWLFKITLTVPAGISSFPSAGGGGQGPTASTAQEILSFNAQHVSVPSVAIETITIPHLNQDVKVAGRPTLGEMTVTLLNSYDLQAVRVIEAWHRLIYKPSTEELNFAANYKTNGTLFVFKPNFDIFKTYQIKGCWPSNIGDKEYDWAASESVTRTITFQVDKVLDMDDV
jgi:hypothetical protein